MTKKKMTELEVLEECSAYLSDLLGCEQSVKIRKLITKVQEKLLDLTEEYPSREYLKQFAVAGQEDCIELGAMLARKESTIKSYKEALEAASNAYQEMGRNYHAAMTEIELICQKWREAVPADSLVKREVSVERIIRFDGLLKANYPIEMGVKKKRKKE